MQVMIHLTTTEELPSEVKTALAHFLQDEVKVKSYTINTLDDNGVDHGTSSYRKLTPEEFLQHEQEKVSAFLLEPQADGREKQAALLGSLMKSPSGRQHLAAGLTTAVDQHLNVQRQEAGLPVSTYTKDSLPTGYIVTSNPKVSIVEVSTAEVKFHRFNLVSERLIGLVTDLLTGEKDIQKRLRGLGVEMVPLVSIIRSVDSPERSMLGFQLEQQYAMQSEA